MHTLLFLSESELTLEEHYRRLWQSRQQAELLHNRECAELCLRKGSFLVSRCRVMCLASSSLDDVPANSDNLIADTHCAEILVKLAMFWLVLPYSYGITKLTITNIESNAWIQNSHGFL